MWNAESPKNLQQTKAEKVGNSESMGDSDKFPGTLQLSSSTNTMINAEGLVFEDSTTPGAVSSRELYL